MSKRYVKEDIDRFYDYDLDISNGTIYMGSMMVDWDSGESGVDFSMAERMIKGIYVLQKKGPEEITIIMNNPGGDWYHGMAIYDAIQNSEKEVTIKVFGHAMSMGAVILQAADKRLLAPHSTMLLHHGTDGYYGHALDMEKRGDEAKRLRLQMEDIFFNRIHNKHDSFTIEVLREKLNFDWFLDASTAVRWGLADGIIGEDDDV
jgi:ATP-dependent Clp protease protease subunit